MVFQYCDNSGEWSVILSEIKAASILEADKIFTETNGKNPSKIPSIGCSLHDDFTFEPFDAETWWEKEMERVEDETNRMNQTGQSKGKDE